MQNNHFACFKLFYLDERDFLKIINSEQLTFVVEDIQCVNISSMQAGFSLQKAIFIFDMEKSHTFIAKITFMGAFFEV